MSSSLSRGRSGLEHDFENQKAIEAFVQEQLALQKKVLQKAQRIEIKNVKRITMQETITFVKRVTGDICKALTQEHQGLLKQFVAFREFTWTELNAMKDCELRLEVAEKLVAETFPVYEQRYASDPSNPLIKYDCLAPEIRQRLRVPYQIYDTSHVEDISLRISLKHMEDANVSND